MMAVIGPGEADGSSVVSQVRRYLEDLICFEGREFVVPSAVALPTPGTGAAPPQVAGASAAELESFRLQICECTACPLGSTRQKFVFGAGNADAGIVFVGEAPGAEEDRLGVPFVGNAGKLLTKIIEAMGLTRDDVYICNVLKCRPPNNRDPQPEEIAACQVHLRRQIRIVKPKIICTLGRIAAQHLLGVSANMRDLRERLHEYEGIPVIATYHPAALLHNPGLKRATWDDVKWLRREYDGVEL